MTSSRAGSPTLCIASAIRPRPSGWPTGPWRMSSSPISSSTCTGPWRRPAAGRPVRESLATLDRALDSSRDPGAAAARLLALAARMRSSLGEVEKAGQVATEALGRRRRRATTGPWAGAARAHHRDRGAGAGDRRAAAVRPSADRDAGRPGADRPAAAVAGQQGHHAGQPRPVRGGIRRGPAGAAARRPAGILHPAGSGAQRPGPVALRHRPVGRGHGRGGGAVGGTKEPIAACCDLGIAAAICFHRGEITAARGISPPRSRTPSGSGTGSSASWPSPAAWTASTPTRRPRRWPMLTSGSADNTEELDEMEDVLADAVRLAATTGDLGTAQALARHAATLAPARRSRTGRPTRCTAAGCWSTMPPGCSPPRSATARPAGRYCPPRRSRRPP